VGQFVVQPSRLQVQAGRLHHKLGKLTHWHRSAMFQAEGLEDWNQEKL
jgi:hypothetical protein